jgi:hypothetical protein
MVRMDSGMWQREQMGPGNPAGNVHRDEVDRLRGHSGEVGGGAVEGRVGASRGGKELVDLPVFPKSEIRLEGRVAPN